MRTPPLLADFIYNRVCKLKCEKFLTRPIWDFSFIYYSSYFKNEVERHWICNEYAIGNCGKGILLGSVCFAVAYGIECLILYITNQNVELEFYASGFSLSGETEKQTGVFFVLICIVFNMINVWMEEGVFRGIFAKFLESISYIKAVFLLHSYSACGIG